LIEYLAETGSTNADLATRIRADEFVSEGHWLVTDRQLAGRGRGGRTWFDGLGNFMGSTFVRPGHGDPPAGTLALVVGLAVQQVVADFLPDDQTAMLKWPNDVMVGTAKLAGILLEREGDTVVLGIGVNLAIAPEVDGRETIALSAFGPAPDRDHFAGELVRCFELELERWRSFGLGPIVNRWHQVGHPVGTPLEVGEPGEDSLYGTFAGLTPDGTLQLRLADGTTRIIHAGEVRFARP
jgi:BirA family biotin operon repressor/biotin-[acetyl-CoA-carboxylase] ligase